jgi:hypothetical protein
MPYLEDDLIILTLFRKFIDQFEILLISKSCYYVVGLEAVWAFDVAVFEGEFVLVGLTAFAGPLVGVLKAHRDQSN